MTPPHHNTNPTVGESASAGGPRSHRSAQTQATHSSPHDRHAPRRLIVLGSTGSIGVNTLQVVDHLRRTGPLDIDVVGLGARRSVTSLIEQARRFGVERLAVTDPASAKQVRKALPDASVFEGDDAGRKLVEETDATDLSAAVVGAAGLPATLEALRKGMRVSLSNKETLVAAGELVQPLLDRHGGALLPVDSEHSAIFQCLAAQWPVAGEKWPVASDQWPVKDKQDKDNTGSPSPPRTGHWPLATGHFSVSGHSSSLRRIILTASGGPFRNADADTMRRATVEQALQHPTWKMGPKVTIDSATMTNKALEIIEAHWLFRLPADKISVIVHPQSVVHSFVEFLDGSVLAQLGPPDMRTPIQYALTYPDRPHGCADVMDWSQVATLTFEQPDYDKFPALRLAYDVIEAGGTAGAIFNAANEAAVEAFLDRRVPFGRIADLVTETLSLVPTKPLTELEDALQADTAARRCVRSLVDMKE